MKIKIYYNTRKIILTNKISKKSVKKKNSLSYSVKDSEELKEIIGFFNSFEKIETLRLYHPNLNVLFTMVAENFVIIKAAGGIVRDTYNHTLFIFRNGVWDLPKGKAEKNELIEQTALREVREECGISRLEIKSRATSTFHIYKLKDKLVLKETVWFNMKCHGECTLIPQAAENITEVKWMAKKDIDQVLKNTYPSIMALIKEVGLINV